VDQALLFLRHDSTVVKITAISDTNFVTQEIVVPPRAANRPFEVMLYFSEYRVNQVLADH
jgi:hypothetical protein